MMKIQKQLEAQNINIDDPSFNIDDYEVPCPNPPKPKPEGQFGDQQMMHPFGMPPPGMGFPPGFAPP